MKNVMMDIETLGTQGLPPIMSIGAVEFDLLTGETGEEFYQNIDLKSCIDTWGMKPNGDTVKWWFDQSQEARDHLFTPEPLPLGIVLDKLTDILYGKSVWGNGSNFDNRIIREAYELTNKPVPWHFRNDMDVRTLVRMGQVLGVKKDTSQKFEGVKHNALDDSKNQVKYCHYIIQSLKEKLDA